MARILHATLRGGAEHEAEPPVRLTWANRMPVSSIFCFIDNSVFRIDRILVEMIVGSEA